MIHEIPYTFEIMLCCILLIVPMIWCYEAYTKSSYAGFFIIFRLVITWNSMFLVGNFFIIVSGDICSIDNNFEVSVLSVGFAFKDYFFWSGCGIGVIFFVIKMNINFFIFADEAELIMTICDLTNKVILEVRMQFFFNEE